MDERLLSACHFRRRNQPFDKGSATQKAPKAFLLRKGIFCECMSRIMCIFAASSDISVRTGGFRLIPYFQLRDSVSSTARPVDPYRVADCS